MVDVTRAAVYDTTAIGTGEPSAGLVEAAVNGIFGEHCLIVAVFACINDGDTTLPDNLQPEFQIDGGGYSNMVFVDEAESIEYDTSSAQQAGNLSIWFALLGSVEDADVDVRATPYTSSSESPGRILQIAIYRNVFQNTSLPATAHDNDPPTDTDGTTTSTTVTQALNPMGSIIASMMHPDTVRLSSVTPSGIDYVEVQQDDSNDGGTFNLVCYDTNYASGATTDRDVDVTADTSSSLGQVATLIREVASSSGFQPLLTTVNGNTEAEGTLVWTTSTSILVVGTSLDRGTEKTYLADGNDFSAATTVEQNISSVTATGFTIDDIDLGSLTAGSLFLFHLVDEGSTDTVEKVSPPFPIEVRIPPKASVQWVDG